MSKNNLKNSILSIDRLNKSNKVQFSNENIYISDESDPTKRSNKLAYSNKKIYHSNESILGSGQPIKSAIKKPRSSASLENILISDEKIPNSSFKKSLNKKNPNANNSSSQNNLSKSKQSVNHPSSNELNNSKPKPPLKPKKINKTPIPKPRIQRSEINQSVNSLATNNSNFKKSNDTLNKSVLSRDYTLSSSRTSLFNEKNNKLQIKKSIKNSKSSSLSNLSSMSNKKSSKGTSLNDYESFSEHDKLNNSNASKASRNIQTFIDEWSRQKTLHVNIQVIFLVMNIFISFVTLGLTIWLNVDKRFLFIANISNQLTYSSFNRLIGLLIYLLLALAVISFVIDLTQIFLFVYVKNFLVSHDEVKLKKIIQNQINLARLANKVKEQRASLNLRVRIKHDLKIILRSIKSITYMTVLVYVIAIIGTEYFLGIYLHFNLKNIVTIQLPLTLVKLVREYEKQMLNVLGLLNVIVRVRYVETNTLEERLVEKMHVQFDCCHYQNPYQFGELSPPSCNFDIGCLNPIQDFLWEYLFVGIIVLLANASCKLLIQFIFVFNFKVVFLTRLVRKLYDFDVRKYKSKQSLNLNEQITDDEESSDDESEMAKEKKRKIDLKLEEIRRQKEEMLAREEEEEEEAKRDQEMKMNEFLELDVKQQKYEEMLLKQNRLEELKFQRMQRQLELQHLFEPDSND